MPTASPGSRAHVDPGALARRLNRVTLAAHAASHDADPTRFARTAFDALAAEIVFEAAWWGMARHESPQRLTLHVSLPWQLPDDFVDCWEAMKSDDALAQAGVAAPGRTVCFGRPAMRRTPGLAFMAERFGIAGALSTVTPDSATGLVTFLSLYRHRATPAFGEADRQLMELAMPHLVLASQAQWLRELAHTRRPDGGPPGALAIVDRMGWLHVAAPGFADCMCAEWPGWRGPQLPEALHCSLSRAARFDGRAITVRARPHGDLIVVDVTHRGPLDRLSPREAEIARRWCRGDSYKAIARDLEVAPTTVRHHLRSIYAKLGVASKAALAQLASAGR